MVVTIFNNIKYNFGFCHQIWSFHWLTGFHWNFVSQIYEKKSLNNNLLSSVAGCSAVSFTYISASGIFILNQLLKSLKTFTMKAS